MNTRYPTFFVAAVLAGCALEKPREEPMPVWEAAQAARDRTFVFCEGQNCPPRTVKTITQPAKTSSTDSGKSKAAPAPQEDARFVVHFPWGSSQLDALARNEMDVITNSEAFRMASEILVAGRTDPSGQHAFNQKLAIRRAETVKAELIAAGVKAESVRATAQDPCCSGETPNDRRPSRALRRADVNITLKTPEP
jgi:outer membrane protein OmpA-like peptidoglycan-associated protein